MKYEYDVFEKFPDGSSLWVDSIPGLEKTRLRLWELAQKSENEFYAINLATRDVLIFNSERNTHGFRGPATTEGRSKSQARSYLINTFNALNG